MSVAKVQTVTRALKDQGRCEKCGVPLPRGSAYRWWTVGFRSKWRHKRCMKPQCAPRPSERESSSLATILAAQEEAGDTLDSAIVAEAFPSDAQSIRDDLRGAVESVRDACQEISDQYREASEAFGGQGESAERADTLEQAVSDLDGYDDPDDPEGCSEHTEGPDDACADCMESFENWKDAAVSAARDLIDGIELP